MDIHWITPEQVTLQEIKQLTENCFGKGYFNPELYNISIESSIKLFLGDDYELKAYALAFLIKEAADWMVISEYKEALGLLNAKYPMFVIKELAVDEKCRRKGLGSQLLARLISLSKSNECNCIYYFHWNEGKEHMFVESLHASGFDNICHMPDFWKNKSLEEGFCCPRCGTPPCLCSLSIYQLSL